MMKSLAIVLSFIIWEQSALAGTNFDSLKMRYQVANYPEALFTTYDRMYSGYCYAESGAIEHGFGSGLSYRKWQSQSEARLDTYDVFPVGYYALLARDYRTAYLFASFPNDIEIRQMGFNFLVRVSDGFQKDKLYCIF